MVDYDVMVFVRHKPSFVFLKFAVDIIDRCDDKSILIVPLSWYHEMRNNLLKLGSDVITEIQLIRPKRA